MTHKNILLAEEDVVVATDLAVELEALGLGRCVINSSVADVLRSIEAEDVDFAILNVNLRDGFVYPAARQLKTLNIPFAFLTSFDTSEIDSEFRDVPRLSKPQDSRAIAKAIAGLAKTSTKVHADFPEVGE